MRTHPIIAIAAGLAQPIRLMGAVVALVAASAAAGPENWPSRPVTMVIPFAAGSGSDVAGRILSAGLSEALGQQVIVENVSGAGGMTGAYRVARAAPDGYEFVLGTAGTHAVNQTLYKKPLYSAATDFAPVILIVEQPTVLVARNNLPANNLAEFIVYARANQATMQFGSPGAGSVPHLACLLLNAATGINVTHVPYRGAIPAMQDLIAGRIDYQCASLSAAIPQIASNMIKAIAILTRDRSPSLPGLASAHEQALTDFEASTWYAIFMPKATPAAIIRKLNDATATTMDTSAVQEHLKQIGIDPVRAERRSPEYLQKFVESEIVKWAVAINAAGVGGQ